MSKNLIKFLSILKVVIFIIFQLSQLVIGRLLYLVMKPDNVVTTIIFVIVLIVCCIIYFFLGMFIFQKARSNINFLDKLLIEIEEYDLQNEKNRRHY